MENAETENWSFNIDVTKPYDPLLNCLLILAKLKNKTISAKALTAGLPLENNKLTPSLFIRAAVRADLSAKIVKQRLSRLSKRHLPVVLFLKNKEVCVLTDVKKGGIAQVIQPESGQGYTEIPLKDLAKIYLGFAIFTQPIYKFKKHTQTEQKPKPKHWFWSAIWRACPIYSEVLAAAFLINLFTIASPLFILNVYDRVIPNNALETLWVLVIGIVIVYFFDFILRNLRAWFIDMTAKKIDVRLSTSIFEQLLDINLGVRPTSVGYLSNTIHAFEAFREFIASATVSVLIDMPFAILFIIVIGMLGGVVFLVPVIITPIVILVSFLVQIPINRLVRRIYQYAAEKQIVLIESLAGIETVKGSNAEGVMQNRWEKIIRALAQLGVKSRMLANIGANFSIYIQHIAVVSVVVIGVYQIANGNMTVGALIACIILTGRALAPISQIAVLLTRYKQTKNSLDSVDNIMKLPTERPIDKTFLHRTEIKGDIEFKDVVFNYPTQPVVCFK